MLPLLFSSNKRNQNEKQRKLKNKNSEKRSDVLEKKKSIHISSEEIEELSLSYSLLLSLTLSYSPFKTPPILLSLLFYYSWVW